MIRTIKVYRVVRGPAFCVHCGGKFHLGESVVKSGKGVKHITPCKQEDPTCAL